MRRIVLCFLKVVAVLRSETKQYMSAYLSPAFDTGDFSPAPEGTGRFFISIPALERSEYQAEGLFAPMPFQWIF